MNPVSGVNWKNPKILRQGRVGNLTGLDCEDQEGGDLAQCLQENSYSYSDVILDSSLAGEVRAALGHGIFQIISPLPGEIKSERRKSLMFTLNSSLLYWVGLTDPNYNLVAINPKTVPRTLLKMKKSVALIYIYIEVIRHISINREESPCQISDDYKYGDCISEAVAREVGCQTFWTNFSAIPTCVGEAGVLANINRHLTVQEMEKNKLGRLTGCYKPCDFMEYKVLFFNFEYIDCDNF